MNPITVKLRQGNEVVGLTQNYSSAMGNNLFRCSIMLHNLSIQNNTNSEVLVSRAEISFMHQGRALQKSFIDNKSLLEQFSSGKTMLSSPPLNLLAKKDSFFPNNVSNTCKLEKNFCGFIPRLYTECFSQYAPDTINIEIFTNQGSEVLSLIINDSINKNKFSLPMKGPIAIIADQEELWGHRTLLAPEFGMDLIVLDNKLQERKCFNSINDDHYCFSEPIYSCAPGIVHSSTDGLPDNPKPFEPKETFKHIASYRGKISELQLGGGNFVLIDHGDQEFILYAHLKCDSVKVKTGDIVETGTIIGECGNSGAGSLTPHLHIQMMSSPEPHFAHGLPLEFCDLNNSIFSNPLLSKLEMPEELHNLVKRSKALLVNTPKT